jgi:hypothetical protein
MGYVLSVLHLVVCHLVARGLLDDTMAQDCSRGTRREEFGGARSRTDHHGSVSSLCLNSINFRFRFTDSFQAIDHKRRLQSPIGLAVLAIVDPLLLKRRHVHLAVGNDRRIVLREKA